MSVTFSMNYLGYPTLGTLRSDLLLFLEQNTQNINLPKVTLSTFTVLCNHHHYPVQKHIRPP